MISISALKIYLFYNFVVCFRKYQEVKFLQEKKLFKLKRYARETFPLRENFKILKDVVIHAIQNYLKDLIVYDVKENFPDKMKRQMLEKHRIPREVSHKLEMI